MNRLLNKVLVSVVIASQFATIPPLTEVAKASTKSSDGLVDNTSNVSVVSQVDGGINSKEEYTLGGTVENQVYLAKKATKATKTKIPVYKVSKVNTKTVNRVHNNLLAHKRFKLQIKASSKKNAQKYMTTLQKKVAEKNGYGILFSCLGYEDGGRAVDQLKMTKVKYVKSGKYYTVEFYAENGKFYDYALKFISNRYKDVLTRTSKFSYTSNGRAIGCEFMDFSDEIWYGYVTGAENRLADKQVLEEMAFWNITAFGRPEIVKLSNLYKRYMTGIGGHMESIGGSLHSTKGCNCREESVISGGAVVGTKKVWTHSEECQKFCKGYFGTSPEIIDNMIEKYGEDYTYSEMDSWVYKSREGKRIMLWSGESYKQPEGIDIPLIGQGTYIWKHFDTLHLYSNGCDNGCQNGVHSKMCDILMEEQIGYTLGEAEKMSYNDFNNITEKSIKEAISMWKDRVERIRGYVNYVYDTPFYKLDNYTKVMRFLQLESRTNYNAKKKNIWYRHDMDNHASDLFKHWNTNNLEGTCGDLAMGYVMLLRVLGVDSNAYVDANYAKNHGVCLFSVRTPQEKYYSNIGYGVEIARYYDEDTSFLIECSYGLRDSQGNEWEKSPEGHHFDTSSDKVIKLCYNNGALEFYGDHDWYWSFYSDKN